MDGDDDTLNKSELLELISGLRDKMIDDNAAPALDGKYKRGADCLYFAKAILRTLRREQRAGGYRAMSQLIKWEVARVDLIPLIMTYRRDIALALTVVKILVALTLPVTRVFEGVQDHVYHLEQVKELFLSRDIVAVLQSLLVEPLSKAPSDRSEDDTLTIDTFLHLFHNLLHIDSSSGHIDGTKGLLDDRLIQVYFNEHVMDVFTMVAQNLDCQQNEQWALLLCKIFYQLFCSLDAQELVYTYHSMKLGASDARSRLSSLRSKEKKRKSSEKYRLSGRHHRFGGTLLQEGSDGARRVVDAREVMAPIRRAPKSAPRTKKEPPKWDPEKKNLSNATKVKLFEFGEMLLTKNVFALLMQQAAHAISKSDTSLNSFQNDVNRYIQLVSFFTRFDYARQLQSIRFSEDPTDLQREHPMQTQVPQDPARQTFTLDHIETVLYPGMVDFLFKRAENILQEVPINYRPIHYIFRALCEILNVCGYLLHNGDKKLRYEAKKTVFRIFVDRRHFLERLPWLLTKVVRSKMPLQYVENLVRTINLTLSVIEIVAELDAGISVMRKQRRKGATMSKNLDKDYEGDEDEEEIGAGTELQLQDFTMSEYLNAFQRNKIISEYCSVLANWETNSEELNNCVWRLFELTRTGAGDTRVSLPAIFFQVSVLCLLQEIIVARENGNKRPSVIRLAEFGEDIVGDLMRLTAGGANTHVFASLLFWRSKRDNIEFEDVSMRLAKDAQELDDSASDDDRIMSEEDSEEIPDFADIMTDPKAIAESNANQAEKPKSQRKKKRKGAPVGLRSAFTFFKMDERPKIHKANPELKGRSNVSKVNKLLTERWKVMTEEQQQPFLDQSIADKARLKREMAEYDNPDAIPERKKRRSKLSKKERAEAKRQHNAEIIARLMADEDDQDEVDEIFHRTPPSKLRKQKDGRHNFTVQEDADLRRKYDLVKGEEGIKVGDMVELLKTTVSWSSPITLLEVAKRLRDTHRVSITKYEAMVLEVQAKNQKRGLTSTGRPRRGSRKKKKRKKKRKIRRRDAEGQQDLGADDLELDLDLDLE